MQAWQTLARSGKIVWCILALELLIGPMFATVASADPSSSTASAPYDAGGPSWFSCFHRFSNGGVLPVCWVAGASVAHTGEIHVAGAMPPVGEPMQEPAFRACLLPEPDCANGAGIVQSLALPEEAKLVTIQFWFNASFDVTQRGGAKATVYAWASAAHDACGSCGGFAAVDLSGGPQELTLEIRDGKAATVPAGGVAVRFFLTIRFSTSDGTGAASGTAEALLEGIEISWVPREGSDDEGPPCDSPGHGKGKARGHPDKCT